MKQGRHTPEKILEKLRQAAADRAQGCTIREVCKRLEISPTTYRRWKRQYNGLKAYDEVPFGEQAERSTESRDFDENQNDWWHLNRSALSAPLHSGASVSLQPNSSSKSFGDGNHIDTCVSKKIRTRWREDLGWTHSSAHARRDVPGFYFLTAFLVGLFLPVTIDFVGKLPISELLLLIVLAHAALAFLTTRALPAPLPSPRILAFVLLCQLVAFASYIVSDLWRESLPFDFVRGWVRMGFLPLNIAALALLFGAGNRTFVLLHIGSRFFVFISISRAAAVSRLLEVLLWLSGHSRHFACNPSVVRFVGYGRRNCRTRILASDHEISEFGHDMPSHCGTPRRCEYVAAALAQISIHHLHPDFRRRLPLGARKSSHRQPRHCNSFKR